MVGVHTRINVGDYSRTARPKNTVSLRHTDDLSGGLIHISVGYSVPVVIHWSGIPQALWRRGRTCLIGVIWRDHQGLVGFGVQYSVDKPKETRKELRQKTLNGPDQENLVQVAIEIADHRTTIGKACQPQPGETEVCSNDDSRLRTKAVGQDLLDV
jgi:hypothetical protein